MSESTRDEAPKVGSIGWIDLTVPDAETVRDFYREVVGWEPQGVDMGGYEDWQMCRPGDGEPAAGVCWARGQNAGLPAQWLVYIVVEDLDRSLEAVRSRGGEVIAGPKGGSSRYAVVRDPAGAVAALWQAG